MLDNPLVDTIGFEADDGWGFVCTVCDVTCGFGSRNEAVRAANAHDEHKPEFSGAVLLRAYAC